MHGDGRRLEGRAFAWSLLAALTLLAAALRLPGLGTESLWYDEAYSLRVARAPGLAALVETAAAGEHPPLYFLLLRLWLVVAPATEASLRLPSALCGIALVPLVYALGRALSLPRAAALLGAALTALNPHALWYAQEARMYALASLLGVLFFALEARTLARPSRLGLLGWTAAGLALLETHHYALFFMGAAAVWALAAAWRARSAAPARSLAAAGLVWLAAWAAESAAMLRAAGGGAGASWVAYRVSWKTPWHVLSDLATGQVFFAVSPWFRVTAALAALVLLLAGPLLARERAPARWAPLSIPVLVIGGAALVSLWRPVLIGGERYPTLVAGPFALALAVGAWTLFDRGRAGRVLAGALLSALVAAQLAYDLAYHQVRKKTMWREAVAYAVSNARAGDALCPVPASLWEPADYYAAGRLPRTSVDELLAGGGAARAWVLDSLPALGAERRLLEAGWRPLQRVDVQMGLPQTLVRVTLFAAPGAPRPAGGAGGGLGAPRSIKVSSRTP